LKSRDFERRGVHRSGWWTPLFCVFGYRCEYGDREITDTIWRNLGLLPKSIVLPNCIKMLLEFGNIAETLFLVDLCFPFPKNSRFMLFGKK